MIKILRGRLVAAPESADPQTINDRMTDPVRLAARIRGLEAVRKNVPKAAATKDADDPLSVSAGTNDGQHFAYAFIGVQHDGTHRLDSFSAPGFQSGEAQCQ